MMVVRRQEFAWSEASNGDGCEASGIRVSEPGVRRRTMMVVRRHELASVNRAGGSEAFSDETCVNSL